MDEPVYQALSELTIVGDLTAAHLLAARLRNEGIEAFVRGEALGPYPVSVGRMAATAVLVPERDLDEARELLEEIERSAAETEYEQAGIGVSPELSMSVLWWVVAAALLGAIVWIRLGVVF